MYTIKRRIKVNYQNAVHTSQNGDGTLKCDRTLLIATKRQDCYQSVLNELLKSNKSELRRMQLLGKIASPALSHISAVSASLGPYFKMVLVTLVIFYLINSSKSILVEDQNLAVIAEEPVKDISVYNNNSNSRNTGILSSSNGTIDGVSSSSSSVAATGYFDKLDNLERSVAAVLIKVAYGTTSTTKRSIPDNSYILGLTTVATPLLTTLRYQSAQQPQITGSRHRNYELDLERDHALPTSAPNADILKSNNNPTYPNPNRHHGGSHDRDRYRHTIQYNSTPMPSIPNLLKKLNGQPTIPMYPGDIPSYSPPSRSFFTPPLPPEYQNPFADKPTLRGTNNEGLIANTVTFNNRRPIPPPSLMPGQERIPFRPPDLGASVGTGDTNSNANVSSSISVESKNPVVSTSTQGSFEITGDRKKALNTPSQANSDVAIGDVNEHHDHKTQDISDVTAKDKNAANAKQEVLPNIRRILGSNGKKGEIPAVLLRQVTHRPIASYHQPPAASIVPIENQNSESKYNSSSNGTADINSSTTGSGASPNINKSKQSSSGQLDFSDTGTNGSQGMGTTPAAAAAIGETSATSPTANQPKPTYSSSGPRKSVDTNANGAAAAAASAHTTWTWAWNIHIYLSVVLFTILSVYSLYKLLTYNKLTHLLTQSYFVYIHLILIAICIMRIFYFCFDAYNIHGTFHIFASELLLNLPSTFLTVAFSVLMLFLFLKSLNHKNNRYSALVRPLTVVVGCGVHVGLCITLHYVESYTLQNHHMYFQQQQQQQYFRRQQQHLQLQQTQSSAAVTISPATSLANPPPPPRVLSLICQIIYIFICLSLGLLYLYLYRILKRILRSKSQNYIHGYQNLSYAIHITIATALLFVLLAILEIFGAVCISTARPLMSQANIVEVDWMQWGYQFSLRLIEIAIITLISWVTGLKTSVGSNANTAAVASGDVRIAVPSAGIATSNSIREKQAPVGNFFLPCTSSSSQEHFETDYPAICNANTNLHTYTMRTGKLIYDDSYALNSMAGPSAGAAASPCGRGTEYQLQEPMYQRPYDTGSIRSAVNHNIAVEYGGQTAQRYHPHHQMRGHDASAYMSADYITDATDHYENPNFDLRTCSTGAVTGVGGSVGVGALQKFGKNPTSSGSASNSGSGSSGTSQQQMLLLQSDSCYSEPLQENSSYEFNNFERPVFKEKPNANDECWLDRDRDRERHKISKCRDRKPVNSTLDRATYENPERRSSNSTNSCSSSNGVRYSSYNSYERGGQYNCVRKSGTLNNIVKGSTMSSGSGSASALVSGTSNALARTVIPGSKRVNGAQTLTERSHCYQRSTRPPNSINRSMASNEFELGPTNGRSNELPLKQQQNHHYHQTQQKHHQTQYKHNKSDEDDEEDDDDVIAGRNVECTNLITNDNSTASKSPQTRLHVQTNNSKSIHQQQVEQEPHSPSDLAVNVISTISTGSTLNSSASEQGFLRFRANEDNIDGVEIQKSAGGGSHGIHGRSISNALSQICSNVNGIDC